jgi:bifunctional DNA primase/polymerase-like protein
MPAHPDRMLTQALAYARYGWPVFPCQPGSKEPATRHGFRDASASADRIRTWWTQQPDANVAIATGSPGPDVLDVDQHGKAGNGFAAAQRLDAAGLLDGARAIVATPGGGLHLYFTGSRQRSGRLSRHHLDFRAAGGYVLAPPSQIDGKAYQLVKRRHRGAGLDWRATCELIEPARHEPARSQPARQADPGRLVQWVERLEPGNRNCGLFWAACRAAEAGQPGLLDDLAIAAARTGLPGREIARTIASARRCSSRLSLRSVRADWARVAYQQALSRLIA